jgi:hypothetical protein
MANQLQMLRQGKDLSAGPTIARITFDANGTPTVAASVDLRPFIVAVVPRTTTTRENAKPTWKTHDNMIVTSVGTSLTLRVLARKDADNALNTLFATADLVADRFRIVWTLATENFAFDGTFADFSDPYENEGQQVMDVSFDPCDLDLGGNLRVS